jgi:hypothetical protein
MSTLIRNVRDLEASNRRSLESLLGQPLREDEQVIIRVIGVGKEPDADTTRTALQRVREISDDAARHRDSLGVSSEEADRMIDEAIKDLRAATS